PGPVGAQEPAAFALANDELDAVDRKSLAERLHQAARFDDRRAGFAASHSARLFAPRNKNATRRAARSRSDPHTPASEVPARAAPCRLCEAAPILRALHHAWSRARRWATSRALHRAGSRPRRWVSSPAPHRASSRARRCAGRPFGWRAARSTTVSRSTAADHAESPAARG